MKALILAAGKGTRLGALTAATPKPMMEVGDRPLLDHLIVWLRASGISQIAINLHHAPEVITSHAGNGSRYGVQITYSHEEKLMGTAGAARRLQWFLDERFVLVHGDGYLNVDLGRIVQAHGRGVARHNYAPGMTMALFRVPNPTECGLVETSAAGDVVRFVEKPPANEVFTDLANAGIYVCDPAILEWIPDGVAYDFGNQMIPDLLRRGVPVMALPIQDKEFVIDIGTPAALAQAQQHANLSLMEQFT